MSGRGSEKGSIPVAEIRGPHLPWPDATDRDGTRSVRVVDHAGLTSSVVTYKLTVKAY
jgi:hypothetical protein